MSEYPLWHRRLGYCPMQTIRDTIPHAKGIEELYRESFDQNQQCPAACMMGKAHLEIRLRSKKNTKRALERVYMDAMSLLIPSMDGRV